MSKVTINNLNLITYTRQLNLWLGGTCGKTEDAWDWRKELVGKIYDGIYYYDPFLRPWETDEDWDEEHQRAEMKAKDKAVYHIYVITSDMVGCFSIAEITDAIYVKDGDHICIGLIDYKDSFTPEMKKSLVACADLWRSKGATICKNLDGVASWINNHCTEFRLGN